VDLELPRAPGLVLSPNGISFSEVFLDLDVRSRRLHVVAYDLQSVLPPSEDLAAQAQRLAERVRAASLLKSEFGLEPFVVERERMTRVRRGDAELVVVEADASAAQADVDELVAGSYGKLLRREAPVSVRPDGVSIVLATRGIRLEQDSNQRAAAGVYLSPEGQHLRAVWQGGTSRLPTVVTLDLAGLARRALFAYVPDATSSPE
jgi:hypothetical protein